VLKVILTLRCFSFFFLNLSKNFVDYYKVLKPYPNELKL
jgi:hypothetical protein